MRKFLTASLLAGLVALAGCETSSGGYGQQAGGYGAPAPRTQLSRCGQQALIGAGIGAALGAVTAPRGNRGENAALGAAAGGLGTYGVCTWLSAREQQRVEAAYYSSLNQNAPISDSWNSDAGAPRSLNVAQPEPAPGYGAQCRRVTASVSDPQQGRQNLPPETFCRDAQGRWVPA